MLYFGANFKTYFISIEFIEKIVGIQFANNIQEGISLIANNLQKDYFFISRRLHETLKYLLFLILTPLFTSAAFADEHAV